MKKLFSRVATATPFTLTVTTLALAAMVALSTQPAWAEDQELKIGVVAAESGSFLGWKYHRRCCQSGYQAD